MNGFFFFFLNTQETSFQGCSDHPAAHCKRPHAHPGCKDRLAPVSHRVFCWVFGCGCAVSAAPHETHERGDRRTQVGALLLGGHARRCCGPFGTGSREKNMNEPESPAANSLLGWTLNPRSTERASEFYFQYQTKDGAHSQPRPLFHGHGGTTRQRREIFCC